ncbi:MAG: HYR domain-containing protein, partial [Phaeodactylibacter sp.]|nr:HYR domain-containing protein [Phaeodactylibacter sp.]
YVGRSHTTVDVGLFSSIKRLSGVMPTNNSGLDATFVYNYFDSELNGQTEADLKLFVSYDFGLNWTLVNGTLDILSNRITLTNQDALGFYTASSGCLETVIQTEAICKQSVEVELDASGTYTVLPNDLDDGSTGACGIASQMVIDGDLDCSDLGSQLIGMQIVGNDGIGSACLTAVAVVDNMAPNAVCANPTISVGADGTVTLTPADLDGGTTDNCNANLSLANTPTYNCNYIGYPQTETLIATDDSGNQSSCVATINIVDNVAPTALCKDYTASLSKSGRYKPKVQHINDGSFDNCGIASMSVDIPVFDCSSIGPGNFLTLTVTDESGNQSSCVAEITIEDNVVPKIRCPLPITVDADPMSCDAVVDYTVQYVDNCPGVTLNQLAGIASGGTFPIGMTTNTYEIVDVVGQSKTCSFVVTVNDPGGCVPAAPLGANNTNPMQFQLPDHQLFAYPNPSANSVQIRWEQAQEGEIQLEVRSLEGQRLAGIADGTFPAGANTIQWNSKDQQISAGIYLLVLSTPDGNKSVLRLVLTP